ncbi:MAG: CHAT domain-containing protein [Proteobacteria bacterium]|nr:CHAT domain-containing protein [Pseudomonadota bacterium]
MIKRTVSLLILTFLVVLTSVQTAADASQESLTQAQALQSQVENAVARSDIARVLAVNEEISRLFSSEPEWITESLAIASSVEEDQAEILEAYAQMSAEAQGAMEVGDFESAVAAQEGAMQLAQEMFGPEHWLTAASMRDLGFIYRQLGMGDEADAYYNEAVALASVILSEEHPQTLEIYGLIAELFSATGALDEAQAIGDLVIGGLSESLGLAHEKTIDARLNQVFMLEFSGLYDEASAALADTCTRVEENYGAWHPTTLECLLSQANLAVTMGDLAEAAALYDLSLSRMGQSLPAINAKALNALSIRADIYREEGQYQMARDLLSGVIQTALQIGETGASYTAKSYLGRVFNNEGKLENARKLTEEVLDFGLSNWLDRPLDIYNTMLELGAIYQRQGKSAEAEATYEEALQGLNDLVGDQHPSTLVALNNLGQVYEEIGLYDKAEPILKRALDNLESTLGPENPQSSRARNNLALLFESQGNFREAEPLYIRSIEILSRTRGDDYTDTIAVRNNLAFLYMMMEEYDRSAEMFERVQEQWMVLFGEEHQATLKAMNNLGRIYHKLERLTEAEHLILRAGEVRRSVLGAEHPDVVRSMIDLGSVYLDQKRLPEADRLLTEALSLAEKILGEQHPYTFEALNSLARVKEAQNQLQAAVEIRETGFARRSVFLDRMLWVTGENAREGYIRLHRPEFSEYLALLTRLQSGDNGKRAIAASLQRKGLLLKVASEIQQISKMSTDPELKKVSEELESARKKLAAMTLSGPTAETQGRHVLVLYELEQKVNELQGELGRASVRYRSSIAQVSVDRLASVIPEAHALVDFLTYEEGGESKILAGIAINEGGVVRYELVQYPDRGEVDDAIIEYRTIIQDDQADEDEILEVGQIAYERVWQPIQDVIGDTKYVYLIPDGTLNILPFNALVTPDEEYLIQTHDLHVLTSGRDLLPNEYRLAQGDFVILAGPDYNSDEVVSKEVLDAAQGRRSAALQLGIRGAGGGLRGLNFAPLPGAEKEGRIIISQVQAINAPYRVFFGADAQEGVLSNMQRAPEILHLATHGFFLKADDTLRKRLLKLQRGGEVHVPPPGDNPLLRAGLAFAGINTNAQFLGDIDTINDGVLTALEVLDLNLSGTKLVVLSACETGIGEIHEGEGVYGLRRSFQEAGVAEVVSSLWAVSDEGTQALMTNFYGRILAGVPARDALRETQLELMDSPEWGYPYIWSAFMMVGSYESAGITVQ